MFIHASFHSSQGMRLTQTWESGTTQGLWGCGRGREPWVREGWAVTQRCRLWVLADVPCSSDVPSSLFYFTGTWFWIGRATAWPTLFQGLVPLKNEVTNEATEGSRKKWGVLSQRIWTYCGLWTRALTWYPIFSSTKWQNYSDLNVTLRMPVSWWR